LNTTESLEHPTSTPRPSSKSGDRDFAVNALRAVEQAIGEHMDGTPLEDTNANKSPNTAAQDGLPSGKKTMARIN
jgi:hypothetical protein